MKTFEYIPSGVCCRKIWFTIDDDNKLHDVNFLFGCDGNLKAIGRLTEGKDAREIAELLAGNQCGSKGTSCADQLSLAIEEALRGQ